MRLLETERVADCPSCGLVIGYRQLCADRKPEWRILTCPRCGSVLSSGGAEPGCREAGIEGDLVRRALRRHGLTVQGLAHDLGISPSRLSHVLAGDGSITDAQLLALCARLEIDPAHIW